MNDKCETNAADVAIKGINLLRKDTLSRRIIAVALAIGIIAVSFFVGYGAEKAVYEKVKYDLNK